MASSTVRRGSALLAGVAAAGLGWSLFEARWFALRTALVPVLPEGAKPISILHVSDLHMLTSQRAKIAWVRQLAELRPDIVINTGDNLGAADALPAVLEALDPLLKLPGAFVFGSNDYYGPAPKSPTGYFHRGKRRHDLESLEKLPAEELAQAFRSAGWLDLNNDRGKLAVGDTPIEFVGVNDPHIGFDRMPPSVDDGLATAEDSPLRIGVAHAPYARILRSFADDGAGLVLAGHTHGGQVCVPFFGALVTNCDLDIGRASGLHGWPGKRPDALDADGKSIWLHVSAGMGTSRYTPVRFACRPECTLLTLVPRVTHSTRLQRSYNRTRGAKS